MDVKRGINLDKIIKSAPHIPAGHADIDRVGLGAAPQWKSQRNDGGKLGNLLGIHAKVYRQGFQPLRNPINFKNGKIIFEGRGNQLSCLHRRLGNAGNSQPRFCFRTLSNVDEKDIRHFRARQHARPLVEGFGAFKPQKDAVFEDRRHTTGFELFGRCK